MKEKGQDKHTEFHRVIEIEWTEMTRFDDDRGKEDAWNQTRRDKT